MTVVQTRERGAASAPLGRYDGGATTDVGRYVWHPVEVPAPPARSGPPAGRVLVLGERVDRADVAARLTEAGWTPLDLDLPGGGEPEEAAATVKAAVAAAGRVDGIVDLGLGREFTLHEHAGWRAALVRTTAALQAVYDDWAAETDAGRCFYLTVTWTGGRMGYDRTGVAQPLGGIWAGIAKSLPHELPACRIKVLDLHADEAADLGRRVTLELGELDYYEVGWRGGARVTLAAQSVPCPPPRLVLRPDDVVLISGGGRGVGYAFAARLARDVGCQVVVTGRSPVPDDEPWLRMDPEEYALTRRRRLKEAGPSVGRVRREHERWDAMRELAANLDAAASAGLSLSYQVCDFLDGEQVRRLVDGLGPRLRVVVHNAGIAAPTRLRGKSAATVLRVVESKLVSFTNLVDAVRGHDLAYFCNVGSVAGRMGGMAGQVDYAGANEVLSRLGFWAQERLGLPVATLCWTTWERVGLIANYEAALRYGSALRVDDGVARWVAEVLAATPTEAMFLGRVGTALSPTQIRGFLKFADHPDLPWLLSRHHYLGRVEAYAPFRSIQSRATLRAGEHPCLTDVRLDGAPALPVSVALEYAVSVGDWLPPEGWPLVHLHEIREVTVDLDHLALAGALEMVTEATARRSGEEWLVDVTLAHSNGAPLISGVLVYRDDPLPVWPAASEELPAVADLPAPTRIGWNGVAFPRPRWRTGGDGVVAEVVPAPPADLWTAPHPPQSVLPSAGVEAVVQGVLREAAPGATQLHLARLERGAVGAEALVRQTGQGCWSVSDTTGRPLLRVTGATVR